MVIGYMLPRYSVGLDWKIHLKDSSCSYEPAIAETEIFDILGHLSEQDTIDGVPKTPILCKLSDTLVEALKMEDIDPERMSTWVVNWT